MNFSAGLTRTPELGCAVGSGDMGFWFWILLVGSCLIVAAAMWIFALEVDTTRAEHSYVELQWGPFTLPSDTGELFNFPTCLIH